MSVGNSELKIVPSDEIGPFGRREGAPTIFEWRWYYHLPSLAFWGVVLVPLVFRKANRSPAAWAVLFPVALAMVVFQIVAMLFAFTTRNTEYLGTMVTGLACGWAIVWLLADWLARRHWLVSIVVALVVVMAAGLLLCACNYGVTDGGEVVGVLLFYGAASFSLLLSMALCGRVRRKPYLSASFPVWLLPWTVVSLCLGFILLLTGLTLCQPHTRFSPDFLLQLMIVSAVGGLALYSLNLPFVLLAFFSPLYRRRFCDVFRLQLARQPAREDGPASCPQPPTD